MPMLYVVLGSASIALIVFLVCEMRRRELLVRCSIAEKRCEQIPSLEEALQLRDQRIFRLEAERAGYEEKMVLLQKGEENLRNAFAALSADALKRNNAAFLDLAKETLGLFQEGAKSELEKKKESFKEMVTPIKETLDKLDSGIRKMELERKGEQETLKTQVASLIHTEKELKAETASLVKALRAPLARGRWGEIQLRRVVELAGMVSHCDFYEQKSFEEGRLRPDLIVRLPGGRQVVIDAKVPLESYLEAIESKDDAVKELKFKDHARQVRAHVQALGKKAYWQAIQPAPEFVVLFLPSETFFSAALEYDPSLIEAGVDQGVVVATPMTLIALLRSVAFGWKQENLSAHAEKVEALGRELYKRICDMTDHFAKMGRGLNSAVDGYNRAIGSLETRVLPMARKFQDLGAAAASVELASLESIDKQSRPLMASEAHVVESGSQELP